MTEKELHKFMSRLAEAWVQLKSEQEPAIANALARILRQ